MRNGNKKNKIIIFVAVILIILFAVICLGLLQEGSMMHSKIINSKTDSNKIANLSSVESVFTSTPTVTTTGGGGSSPKSSSSSSGPGSSAPALSAASSEGVILAAGETEYPQFSNYWDNSGTQVSSGTGYFNVTVTGTNGTVILNYNNISYPASTDNWLNFDGINDYVGYGYDAKYSPQNSISFYVRFTPNSLQDTTVVSKGTGGEYQYALKLTPGGVIYFVVYTNGGSPHCETSGYSPFYYTPGTEYTVYAEYINQTSCSIQVNGGTKATQTTLYNDTTAGVNIGTGADLRVGNMADGGANFFNGMVSEFIFYDSTSTPIINTQYNEGYGTIAYDSSGLGNNGVINSATWSNNPYTASLNVTSGTYSYKWYSWGINNSYNESGQRSYTVNMTPDITPPYFTAIPATTNINYTQGFGVDFNALDERGFGTYAINWTTLFKIDASGWLTNSTPNIATGNYYIKVTINDTSNNLNSTIYLVNVAKATPILTVVGTSPINYGIITNVTGSGCPSQLTCSLDKANAVYGAGTITFNYSTAGNANYSTSSVIRVITVNKATPALTINGTSPIAYGTMTDVIGDACPSQLTCSLSPANGIYGVGTVTFNYSTVGNANYTSSSITKTITMNKATPALTINGTTPIAYGTMTDVIGDACPSQLTCSSDKTNAVYGAGTVTFNYSTVGNANYTSSSITKTITINKATPALTITGTSPITEGTMTDVAGDACPAQLTCSLSPTNGIYGVGNVTFNYSTIGNANYTSSSIIKTIVISSKIIPVLTITGTSPIAYGATTDVAGSGCPSQLTCSLDKANAVYGAGTITFNYSTAGNANYSASSITRTVVINKATSVLTITGTSPIAYGTMTDVIGDACPSQLTCSSDKANAVYGAGTVTFNYSTIGNANYSASSITKTITINKAIFALTINGTSPISYGTATNVAGSNCPSQLTCSLSPANGIYGVGTVTFNYSTVGNANYTSSSIIKTIVISSKIIPVLTITGTSPITYGTTTDVAGDSCPSQLTCSLDKANAVYGAGTVTFNYSTVGNANYSASSITRTITIDKAALNYAVTLTSPINYPTASDYIGRITNGEASCSPILYRNNVNIGTGFSVSDTVVLAVGSYTYKYSTAGCVNYTDSENTKTLIVNAVACYSNNECDDSNVHTQDVCNNPGTLQASCSHLAIACLADNECDDSNVHTQDVCNNPGTTLSSCSHLAIACLANTECGTNGFVSTPTCQSDNIWQNFITYTCNNPGTPISSCTDSTVLQSKETCSGGCIDGRCKIQSCTTVCSYGKCKEYCVWQ